MDGTRLSSTLSSTGSPMMRKPTITLQFWRDKGSNQFHFPWNIISIFPTSRARSLVHMAEQSPVSCSHINWMNLQSVSFVLWTNRHQDLRTKIRKASLATISFASENLKRPLCFRLHICVCEECAKVYDNLRKHSSVRCPYCNQEVEYIVYKVFWTTFKRERFTQGQPCKSRSVLIWTPLVANFRVRTSNMHNETLSRKFCEDVQNCLKFKEKALSILLAFCQYSVTPVVHRQMSCDQLK